MRRVAQFDCCGYFRCIRERSLAWRSLLRPAVKVQTGAEDDATLRRRFGIMRLLGGPEGVLRTVAAEEMREEMAWMFAHTERFEYARGATPQHADKGGYGDFL